jgi:hypothetical protein
MAFKFLAQWEWEWVGGRKWENRRAVMTGAGMIWRLFIAIGGGDDGTDAG